MSMRQIYERFVRGMPITGGKTPLYEEPGVETAGRPIQSYDLTELQELAEGAKEVISEEKERQKKRSKEQHDAKYKTDVENAVNERLKASKQAVQGAPEA